MIKNLLLVGLALVAFSACSEEKKASSSSASMSKCGAGKCGVNMIDGNSALAKKKKNVLRQMSEEDKRKDCVINAPTTKEVYDCVRSPVTNKLSLKCGVSEAVMKCGASTCGNASK